MNLKARFTEPTIVLAPGVYDALSALAAEQAGFEAPCRITERLNLPVIVDADTGFGNAVNVQRTVRGLERAGTAMIQLEDQSFPKRCGHLEGKTVVPTREMCGKLRAALDSRVGDALILARTDALDRKSVV